MSDVDVARRRLLDALGEYAERYWSNLKLWYRQKISKEEFDSQAYQFLGQSKVHFHNEFILAILARCHAHASAPAPPKAPAKAVSRAMVLKKPKIKKPPKSCKAKLDYQFKPGKTIQYVNKISDRSEELSEDTEFSLCRYDYALPDVATLHGRLFLGAWESGLESVVDGAARYVSQALETYVKNILTSCVALRKSYRLKDGRFKSNFTGNRPRPILKNHHIEHVKNESNHRTADEAEADALVLLASCPPDPEILHPISLFELRDAMQVHRSVNPSFSIFAINMERTLATMWHPGHEEQEQSHLYNLDTKRLQERLKQQRTLRV